MQKVNLTDKEPFKVECNAKGDCMTIKEPRTDASFGGLESQVFERTHQVEQDKSNDKDNEDSGDNRKVLIAIIVLIAFCGIGHYLTSESSNEATKSTISGVSTSKADKMLEGVPHESLKKKHNEITGRGNESVHVNNGTRKENEEKLDKEAVKAVEWYRRAAEQGKAVAQRNLGICYENGTGVTKDTVKAVEWYRKAAEQGDAKAQRNLGICFFNGTGVTKDVAKAVEWLSKAAEQGDAVAQRNLGICYENGTGVTKDTVKAVEWYRRAAEQGNAEAQINLGFCYEKGTGVTKDAVKAVEWYRRAAEQGNAEAQLKLGICFYEGTGVKSDIGKAAELFRQAADQGDARGESVLASLYQEGQYSPRSQNEAFDLLRVSYFETEKANRSHKIFADIEMLAKNGNSRASLFVREHELFGAKIGESWDGWERKRNSDGCINIRIGKFTSLEPELTPISKKLAGFTCIAKLESDKDAYEEFDIVSKKIAEKFNLKVQLLQKSMWNDTGSVTYHVNDDISITIICEDAPMIGWWSSEVRVYMSSKKWGKIFENEEKSIEKDKEKDKEFRRIHAYDNI